MRYYSILHPVGLGTFPVGYKVNGIVNFDSRKPCAEIGDRLAWGYIDFEGELLEKDAQAYDLVHRAPESRGCILPIPSWQPVDYDELDYVEGRCLGDDWD